MLISACLVVHNEEKVLGRCLQSIIGIVDEIILVHDGKCTDKSLEIAKRYKAKIYTRDYIGEAEYHRPFSYQQSKGEWVLQIDADEYLSAESQKQIPFLIRTKEYDAYQFSWPYFEYKGYIKNGPFSKTYKPCLFRKKKMYMIGISHEYPRTYGQMHTLPIRLEHRPAYNNYSYKSFQRKWKKWAQIQANQIYTIEKAPLFNISDVQYNHAFLFYRGYRKHPFWTSINLSFKFKLIYLVRGIIFSGKKSWLIAIYEIIYIWLVGYYIYKIHGRRI